MNESHASGVHVLQCVLLFVVAQRGAGSTVDERFCLDVLGLWSRVMYEAELRSPLVWAILHFVPWDSTEIVLNGRLPWFGV